MKNGKKPTRAERIHMKSYVSNPEEWLIYKKIDNQLHLVHRHTNTTKAIPST